MFPTSPKITVSLTRNYILKFRNFSEYGCSNYHRPHWIPISLNLPEKQTIIVIDRFYMAVKRILHKDLSKRALIIAKLNVKSSYGKRILLSKDILVSIYCNGVFKKVPPYRAAGLFIDEESIIGSVFSLH